MPVLVMVSAWVGLVVPRGWLEKLRDVALSVALAVGLVPNPVTVICWGGVESNLTVRDPLKERAE